MPFFETAHDFAFFIQSHSKLRAVRYTLVTEWDVDDRSHYDLVVAPVYLLFDAFCEPQRGVTK